MIRIPTRIAEAQHIKKEKIVKVTIQKIQNDWFGLIPGLTPFNKQTDRAHSKHE